MAQPPDSTSGGCPTEWFLSGPAPGDEGSDKNGDGLICVKPVDGNGNSVFFGWVAKDNNTPVRL